MQVQTPILTSQIRIGYNPAHPQLTVQKQLQPLGKSEKNFGGAGPVLSESANMATILPINSDIITENSLVENRGGVLQLSQGTVV